MSVSSKMRAGPAQRVSALWSRLRIPARAGHSGILDGWRGLCILLVIAGHFFRELEALAGAGVELFFVLSGRLMAEILIFKKQPIGLFLRRRIARIGPAIAVYVALASLAVAVVLAMQGQALPLLSPLAALFFFHNYLLQADVMSLFEHTWSLAVEEHSYLLLVAIAVVAGRQPKAAAWLALGVSALALASAYRLLHLPYSGGQEIFRRSDVRVASVLISFALCIQAQSRDWRVPAWLPLVSVLGSIGLFALLAGTSPLLFFTCTALAALSVNNLSSSGPTFRTLLASPALVWFGTLSYSIYVWQQLFFVASHGKAWAPLCIPLVLLCAVASFKLVENPARDHLNRKWGRTPLHGDGDLPAAGVGAA